MLTFEELEVDIGIVLRTLNLSYKKVNLTTESAQFINEDFGLVVSLLTYINDYSSVFENLKASYPGYRYVFISLEDEFVKKKDEIIWALMEGGYMLYIRKYRQQLFRSVLAEGFGDKIINERLKRWNNNPRYKFFIEMNIEAKNMPVSMILSNEPGFFDYMPREY
ncbi:MAG: hypothetical protein PVG39_02390 [Desulfobacteraceae bacterium]|jgi:hypothetical protein